jgi:hypothetical protein
MLVDTVRNVEAAVVDNDNVASGRNTPAMKRPMCCESGVTISINLVFKLARHTPSADRVVIAGKSVTHLYSTQMI